MKNLITFFGILIISTAVMASESKRFSTITDPDDVTFTLSSLVNETIALTYKGTNLAVLAVNNYQAKQIDFVSYDNGRSCIAIVTLSHRQTNRTEVVHFEYGNGYGQVDKSQYLAPDLTIESDDLNRVPGVILSNCR